MIKIYLDTCIVIYLIEKTPGFVTAVEQRLNNLTEYELCFSPLVEMECLVKPFRDKDEPLKQLFFEFFESQTRLEIPEEVFMDATQLRANNPSLKTPDALHIATATHHGCDEFWTNDNRLDSIAPDLVKNIL